MRALLIANCHLELLLALSIRLGPSGGVGLCALLIATRHLKLLLALSVGLGAGRSVSLELLPR